MLLTGRDVSELVLDASIHFADREENPARQLVLVVQSQPFGEQRDDLRLEDLRARKLGEWLLFEYGEVLSGFRFLAESLRVTRRRCHLAKDGRGNFCVGDVRIKVNFSSVNSCLLIFIILLNAETLCTF